MPRKRFIAPEFFTHADLFDAEAASGLPLRLTFAALWCQADRRGVFPWKPRELKLACLPYDDVDFCAVLAALEAAGFVRSYVVHGRCFGVIPSFTRWQSFHKDERASDAPDPPAFPATAEATPGHHGGDPVLTSWHYSSSRPTSITTSTTTSSTAAVAVMDHRPAGGSRVAYQQQLDELLAAGLPHERAALHALVRHHPSPDVLVLELHATASGLHVIRGQHSGRAADVTDVMRAVAEMAAAAKPFSVSLFRGFVRRVADRAPEPPSAEEREAARLAKQIAAMQPAVPVEAPRSAEEIEQLRAQREAAMAAFRAEFHKYNPKELAA